MNKARESLGLAVLGDQLYAIGGTGRRTVECLDLSIPDGHWAHVTAMSMERKDFGAVVTSEKIYAIGGINTATRNSMECFDPNEGLQGQWTISNGTFFRMRHARFAMF